MERYALYYSLGETDSLFRKVDCWYNPGGLDGARPCQNLPEGLNLARHEELVSAPRRYGFHGTLKPPFSLADGTDIAELEEAVADYCSAARGFEIGTLQVRALGSFLAMVPTEESPLLKSLAADLVTNFDRFRAPQSAEDENKRRKAGLTDSQENNLVRWGYPYVFDDFRFHMTLTGQIPDPAERSMVLDYLSDYLAPEMKTSQQCDGVYIFRQPDRTSAFQRFRYIPLG